MWGPALIVVRLLPLLGVDEVPASRLPQLIRILTGSLRSELGFARQHCAIPVEQLEGRVAKALLARSVEREGNFRQQAQEVCLTVTDQRAQPRGNRADCPFGESVTLGVPHGDADVLDTSLAEKGLHRAGPENAGVVADKLLHHAEAVEHVLESIHDHAGGRLRAAVESDKSWCSSPRGPERGMAASEAR